jgi:anaerobic glycerol-3-phosphate dehydrogenase
MNESQTTTDVSIIGGGFSGLYLGILLKMKGIHCEIFNSGTGASQFWVGTMDFLDYHHNKDLESSFNEFNKEIPHHPYGFLNFNQINRSFIEFSSQFPEFTFSIENNKITNKYVLTTLGNLKPCVGMWNTIFHELGKLDKNSIVILVDFSEFNNDAMYLVAKNLKETFSCTYKILKLSLKKLFDYWEENEDQTEIKGRLSEYRIANYFDTHSDKVNVFGDYIQKELKNQNPEINLDIISSILFPPILGLKAERKIISLLSKYLKIECRELVALSPSLMSKRFNNSISEKVKELEIPIHNNFTFIEFDKINDQEPHWKLKFVNKDGKIIKVRSRFIVIAVGTLFQEGALAEFKEFKELWEKNSISIPNKLSSSFELLFNDDTKSNIFVCGSALFSFMKHLDDEDEIKYGTGLGLSIVSGAQIAAQLEKTIL